jgi:hypothetical protein
MIALLIDDNPTNLMLLKHRLIKIEGCEVVCMDSALAGLKGDSIPLEGRIVAVADVFDALTSTRPYKMAWPMEKAVEFLMEQRGHHFDPACVDAFLSDLDDVLSIKAEFLDHADSSTSHPLANY